MKRFFYLLLISVLVSSFALALDETAGMRKAEYYPINSANIQFNNTASANRDFMDDVKIIGTSSYDHYPCSYNNWGMGYEASQNLTYIVFTDCDQVDGVDWNDITTFDRVIAYNVIDEMGEPMLSPEGEAEPTYAGYPDLVTAVNSRPYVAFHKNDGGYFPWIKGDQYNLGGTQVIWHDKVHPPVTAEWIWPQIRMTRPTDGTEGIIYMMGTNSVTNDNTDAQVCKTVPQVDLNGYLADPFYVFSDAVTPMSETESILHPSLAVSDDGSVIGIIYTHGSAETSKCKYVYSTDEGATWSDPVDLAFDNSLCDVDGDGVDDGNWSVGGTGIHLFFNALNEPCVSYIKNVTNATGNYYPFTSKVYFGKIDVDNAELIETRVSDVIDAPDDVTGGACGPNAASIAARVATAGGGQFIFIAWVDARDMLAENCSNAEIYYSYSLDWGQTWSEDVNISGTQTDPNDKDEVWLTMAPQVEFDSADNSAILHLMFMWDESAGNSVSDTQNPGEITVNQINFYKFDTGVMGIKDDYKLVSKTNFKLNQNKPNPFNPVTSVSFDLMEADYVKVSVYNVKGELVNVIADGNYNAGSHTLVWDGKDANANSVASGVYFYTMETSNASATKKMVLMK